MFSRSGCSSVTPTYTEFQEALIGEAIRCRADP